MTPFVRRVTIPAGRTGPGNGRPLHALPAHERHQKALLTVDQAVEVTLRESHGGGAAFRGTVIAVANPVLGRGPAQLVVRTGPGRTTVVAPLGAIDRITYQQEEV